MSRTFSPTLRSSLSVPLSVAQVDANFSGISNVANSATINYFAASQVLMLSLVPVPQAGDTCFRSDIPASYVFLGGDPTNITSWTFSVPVPSVFGRAGAILAQNGDYTVAQVTGALASADLANTSDMAKGDALVGVKQPYTNAIATTQHEFNSRTLYARDLGSDISASVTAIGSTVKTLIIDSAITALNDTTIPANIYLVFTSEGYISVTTGKILTINGQFSAPQVNVFQGLGAVAFGRKPSVVYPQWWYSGTGVINAALQKACSLGGKIEINQAFTLDGTQITMVSNTEVYCVGSGSLTATTDLPGLGALFSATSKTRIIIRDMVLLGGGYIAGLVQTISSGLVQIKNNKIFNCNGGIAIYIREDSYWVQITGNYIYKCLMGIETVRSDDVYVAENTVDIVTAAGIYFWIGNRCHASHNNISNCGDIGIDVEGGIGHIVSHNNVSRCNNAELGVWADTYPAKGASTSTVGLHHLSINNNQIISGNVYTDINNVTQAVSTTTGAIHIWSVGDEAGGGHPDNNTSNEIRSNKVYSSASTPISSSALAQALANFTVADNVLNINNPIGFMVFNGLGASRVLNNQCYCSAVNAIGSSLFQDCLKSVISGNTFFYAYGKLTAYAVQLNYTSVVTGTCRFVGNTFVGASGLSFTIVSNAASFLTAGNFDYA